MVSIHALLAECDPICRLFAQPTVKFQSTHSLRSATPSACTGMRPRYVSIHALLAECDLFSLAIYKKQCCFNPRTPCGVRLWRRRHCYALPEFQSTHSLRSATQPTLYITTQQSKSYFAPTSLKRPSLHGYTF